MMCDDDEDNCNFMSVLPTEIFLYIFTYLPAKDLIKCRLVCSRFKCIVDAVARSDVFWQKHCQRDFSSVCQTARRKSRSGLLWYHIYRSLSLWSRLSYAREIRDEFASASRFNEEIKDFEIVRDGILGVHKLGAIVYYSIETLEVSKREPIRGDYFRYTESDDTIVILGSHLHLYVMRKQLYNVRQKPNVTFCNVRSFILANNELYFVKLNNKIFLCNLDDDNLKPKFIAQTPDCVMCLGYSNSLHVLTVERKIYTVHGDEISFTCSLDASINLMHKLWEYQFLEHLDWRVYYQWMYVLNHNVPEGPLRDIIIVRSYGDVFFVGTDWGVLRIYYAPYSSGKLDLFNAHPVKQYNFMERNDCPVLSTCPIRQVDVSECEDGHTVVVAMPKKIAVLHFVHNFKRTAAYAMLPYMDIEKVKILKIE